MTQPSYHRHGPHGVVASLEPRVWMHYLGHRFWAFVLFELGPHDSGFNNKLSRFVLRVLFGHAIICLAGSVPVSKSRFRLDSLD